MTGLYKFRVCEHPNSCCCVDAGIDGVSPAHRPAHRPLHPPPASGRCRLWVSGKPSDEAGLLSKSASNCGCTYPQSAVRLLGAGAISLLLYPKLRSAAYYAYRSLTCSAAQLAKACTANDWWKVTEVWRKARGCVCCFMSRHRCARVCLPSCHRKE